MWILLKVALFHLAFSNFRPVARMEALLSVLFSSEEEELFILDCMAYFMVLMAVCTFFTLLFENVPYGRYTTSKYGFPVNSRFAWFVQELPAFFVPICLLVWTSSVKSSLLPNQLLIAMYFCHYVQRYLIHLTMKWHLEELQLMLISLLGVIIVAGGS